MIPPNILEKINPKKPWQHNYKELMLLGKSLPSLPVALKSDEALVNGCESKVWLHIELDESNNTLLIVGDSDTRIVKGLLAIVFQIYNNKTPEESNNIDAYDIFNKLGLIQHLSPSRGNGIKAIIDKINQFNIKWLNAT